MKKYLIYLVILLLAVAFSIFGAYDDSPGAVLIGFLVIIAVVVLAVRGLRKK